MCNGPMTLGIIRFGAFEQKIHTIDNSIKCKSVSKNVEIPRFVTLFKTVKSKKSKCIKV